MALKYVRSGAGGAGTGADWANAYTTLAAAAAGAAAGDTIYVAEDHAESQASAMTITFPGTIANPNLVLCVDHAGSVPPVSADLRTTASVTTTGGNAMTLAGSFAAYGIAFNCATSGVNISLTLCSTVSHQRYTKCALKAGCATNPNILIGSNGGFVWLEGTTMQFGGTSGTFNPRGRLVWRDTPSAIVGTPPSTLFDDVFGSSYSVECEGVDLSAITGTIVGAVSLPATMFFSRCKLNASATLSATQATGLSGGQVVFSQCDSGAVACRLDRPGNYAGAQSTELTIVRAGGAHDGTNAFAWKLVTTANAKAIFPFESTPIAVWNDLVGSPLTLTLEGVWGGGAVPNNDEIWMEVEYLGSSGSPVASFVSCGRADLLAAPAAQPASAASWGGGTTAFKLQATFTPQMKGPVIVRVFAGKASSTFYIDPQIALA